MEEEIKNKKIRRMGANLTEDSDLSEIRPRGEIGTRLCGGEGERALRQNQDMAIVVRK